MIELMMGYFSKYTLFVGRALALATFLASSGFTAIVHNCTMEVPVCCEAPKEINHKDCGESVPANKELAVRSNAACHTNTVVGGVTTNPAVLEKDGKSDVKKLQIAESIVSASIVRLDQLHTPLNFFSDDTPVFLPSVEKYILNASFLI